MSRWNDWTQPSAFEGILWDERERQYRRRIEDLEKQLAEAQQKGHLERQPTIYSLERTVAPTTETNQKPHESVGSGTVKRVQYENVAAVAARLDADALRAQVIDLRDEVAKLKIQLRHNLSSPGEREAYSSVAQAKPLAKSASPSLSVTLPEAAAELSSTPFSWSAVRRLVDSSNGAVGRSTADSPKILGTLDKGGGTASWTPAATLFSS